MVRYGEGARQAPPSSSFLPATELARSSCAAGCAAPANTATAWAVAEVAGTTTASSTALRVTFLLGILLRSS